MNLRDHEAMGAAMDVSVARERATPARGDGAAPSPPQDLAATNLRYMRQREIERNRRERD